MKFERAMFLLVPVKLPCSVSKPLALHDSQPANSFWTVSHRCFTIQHSYHTFVFDRQCPLTCTYPPFLQQVIFAVN
jgi:hypothetical protein